MENLDQLGLNQNRMTHLGAGYFRGLRELKALHIDHNAIKTIHMNAFEGLEGTWANECPAMHACMVGS